MGTDSLSDYTMLKFAVVLSVVAATYAGPGIDYDRCATVSGYWGETVSCAAGSYAVSFCAVQTGSQCNNQYTTLKCCNQKASKKQRLPPALVAIVVAFLKVVLELVLNVLVAESSH